MAVASCQLNQQEGCQQILTMFSRYPRVKDYLSQKGFRPRQFVQIVIDANSGKCTPDDPQSCYLLGSAYSDLGSLTRGNSLEEYEFLVGKLQVYFEKSDNFAAKFEAVNKSCATGQLRQCKKISLEVVGRNPNPNTWGDLFDASLFGCENNIQSACRLLSDRKADVPSFLVTKQRVSRLEGLCDRQIGNACLRLANIYWDEKNTDQALKNWLRGCDAGEATSCVRFANVNLVLYSERPSVDKLSVVSDALNRGCYSLEDDFSCHLLEHLLKG
ncbi:MAG: hypothetical protein GXP03_01620 [Alphaproteobacteria bacterium]|nr:hypothetical protein [Alphaproteobacteria bacterium]